MALRHFQMIMQQSPQVKYTYKNTYFCATAAPSFGPNKQCVTRLWIKIHGMDDEKQD